MSISVFGLDEIIDGCRDAREVKRALCVKMSLGSLPVSQICGLLNVSPAFVSKWRGIYKAQGAEGLGLGYAGSRGLLTPEQRATVIGWIQGQGTVQVAQVRDDVQEHHGVSYKSPQSYYELMHEAGLSYHKSEKVNPKRDEEQVQQRRAEIKKNWVDIKRK
jgi:putative transposase